MLILWRLPVILQIGIGDGSATLTRTWIFFPIGNESATWDYEREKRNGFVILCRSKHLLLETNRNQFWERARNEACSDEIFYSFSLAKIFSAVGISYPKQCESRTAFIIISFAIKFYSSCTKTTFSDILSLASLEISGM